MFELKYFQGIQDEQEATKNYRADAAGAFDFNILGPDTLTKRLTTRLTLWAIKTGLSACRAFWPLPRIGRLVVVTLDADVREVLKNTQTFGVPYGTEMRDLGGGADFVLGLDGDAQKRQRDIILSVVRRDDAAMLVGETRKWAEQLISSSRGRIDVMGDLITRVATETCATYFGFDIEDVDAFAEWSMSVSAVLFADPTGNLATRKLALAGAARLRDTISAAMAKIDEARRQDPRLDFPDTLVGRLMRLRGHENLADPEIVSILVGLVTGFIPTTTLAAGDIVEELLRRPGPLAQAIETAKAYVAGEAAARDRLETLLFETARLNPALNPGQWRYANKAGTIAAGTRRARDIEPGTVLMVSTASAMRDYRAVPDPNAFRLDRPKDSYGLVFGDGPHNCIGKYLAMAQIVEIMAALLSQPGIRPSSDAFGRMFRVGVFPRRLDMVFAPKGSTREQSMATVLVPFDASAKIEDVKRMIEALGNPAAEGPREALIKSDVVHFASLNAIDIGDAAKPAPHVLLELNGDGSQDELLEAVANHAGEWLAPIFAAAGERRPLIDALKANALTLNARPSRSTGLCFFGTPELPVVEIAMQERLSKFCRDALDFYFATQIGFGNKAYHALSFVRALIRGDAKWVQAAQAPGGDANRKAALSDLLARGAAFRPALVMPNRQELNTLAWKERTDSQALIAFLTSAWSLWAAAYFAAASAALGAVAFGLFGFSLDDGGFALFVGRAAISLMWGFASALLLVALVVGIFVGWLLWCESTDAPDDSDPDMARIREIAARENPPGFLQNHFLSVSDLKPGLFRKFTLGVALWGIAQLITFTYRPGYIIDMGTIHFARWFRPPGTEKLVFLSNYDGSWESYLEDFIMKAHAGQSAAWSNAVGFPRTWGLIFQGAQDGDRFKRWVRRQQAPTQFWFNRFPDMTTEQMRGNAVIHHELARAKNDTQARAWLSYFGSMPEPDEYIETDEVQSLVFRGLRALPFSTFAAIRLPENAEARRNWLRGLVPQDGPSLDGPDPTAVTFGDHPFEGSAEKRESATFVAFAASGLQTLGLKGADQPDGLGTFPSIFNLGMASRERVLGDVAQSAPSGWRWSDAGDDKGAHVAILIFATDAARCQELLEAHLRALGGDVRVLYRLDTQPSAKGLDFEPFGFRDGISQPVIRGTQRFAKGALPRDIMEPGEFILGYKNNQGYFPPTPTVAARTDRRERLSATPITSDSRYTAFQTTRPESRDFGRNGVFLAARQFEQYVDAFQRFTEAKAEELKSRPRIAEIVGSQISDEWVAAKMMGRWRDGTPLLDRSSEIKTAKSDLQVKSRFASDVDLDFGADDPQGLRCPFGAHIRRANPRGALDPADPSQIEITNRHRIMRRGRAYQIRRAEGGEPENGLLFLGLCVDIERQFEFVQQSWISSPSFAGLTREPDPIVAVKNEGAENVFSIPTSAGPITLKGLKNFVDVRGGGYFFMPSRSALLYLADLNSP